jgi:hypothetical protein
LAEESGEPVMHLAQQDTGYLLQYRGKPWVNIAEPLLAGARPETTVEEIEGGWVRVRHLWRLDAAVQQDDVHTDFRLQFSPDFFWAPHLAPQAGDCIAQHVFRSPALIAAQRQDTLVIVPDLDICGARADAPWYLDLDAPSKTLALGMSLTAVPEHVRYSKIPGMTVGPGEVELGYYMTAYEDDGRIPNPWERVSGFLWKRYGQPLFAQGEPLTTPMDRYVEHTYNWAFNSWKGPVWQEFTLDGTKAGGPAFIVHVSESPNSPDPANLREFLSVWNQAWFSTLRAMGGAYRYGQRTDKPDLLERARMSKVLALAAPMKDGIFPSVYRTDMEKVEIDGQEVQRSKGWDTGYWTNSNRVPWNLGVTPSWYHVLDASWTALLMLRWHEELEADPDLVRYAQTYGDKLLTLQDGRGFFPAWLHPETLAPSPVLAESPEISMSVTFLLKLAEITGEQKYRAAALRAMDAVLVEIVPGGRWEDFETYWSCCGWGQDEFLGKRIPRNALYKQCNFSMFWTAEALLAAWKATGELRYLDWGRRTLDELSMTQQVWQPPFIYIPALGGFGVMNFDGEWNDSRECLFAELFMDYYRATGERELFERGIAALKSAFVMMYCPENPEVKSLWEKVWPFFGPEDYGFTMENYGHIGTTSPEGEGVGEFTIFTWGNGAAAEARNRIRDHYGDVFIDRIRGKGFGIDSVTVEKVESGFVLKDFAHTPRDVRVVYEDGSSKTVKLSGETRLQE